MHPSQLSQGFAKQLARVFGVAAAAQGGGSSGHTCLVLQATADMNAQLSEAGLQQLQLLLKAELAKEMSSAAIARDDTLLTLKKDKKQRRRCVELLLCCAGAHKHGGGVLLP